jgi:pilus assembly protein CpaB
MNRSTRTFLVVAIAVILASGATGLVWWTIKTRPREVVEVAHAYAVVAAHPLTLGARVTPADVKAVPWPAANPVPGGFVKVEDVIDRGVIAPVAENEPLTANNVAAKEAGVGLPPTIPPGMRAISVKVNEVIGVAGFVIPSTRVDVMVILREGTGSVARVVVSNVQVLAAGTRYDQEVAREGKAIPSTVVTLLVNPDDAERVGLAAAEGQILLTLRNPLDTAQTASTGTRMANLASGSNAPVPAPESSPRPRRPSPPPPPPPPAPEPPKPSTIEVIKAGAKTQEVIRKKGQEIIQ